MSIAVLLMAALPLASVELLRVVTFGTSITTRGGWQQPLAHALSQCLKRPVSVQAIGGPGQGSEWGLANAGRVTALKPDLVIVEFAINDADLRNWISPRSSRHNMVVLAERLGAGPSQPRVVLMTTNPVTGWKRLLRPRLERYYAEYHLVSAKRRVGLADGQKAWSHLKGRQLAEAIPDGTHPRPDVFAKIMVPHIVRASGLCIGHVQE